MWCCVNNRFRQFSLECECGVTFYGKLLSISDVLSIKKARKRNVYDIIAASFPAITANVGLTRSNICGVYNRHNYLRLNN